MCWVLCITGGTQAIKGLTEGLNLKGYSETPVSPAGLFEVVADDLQTLNKNLQSVSNAFPDWFMLCAVFTICCDWLIIVPVSSVEVLCCLCLNGLVWNGGKGSSMILLVQWFDTWLSLLLLVVSFYWILCLSFCLMLHVYKLQCFRIEHY